MLVQSIFLIVINYYLKCNYVVPAVLCIIIFVAFGAEAYISGNNFWGLFALLILYGYVFNLYSNDKFVSKSE